MVSTDLEIGVRCFINAKVLSTGSATIPAKKFGSIIRELPAKAEVEIKIDSKSHIDIKSGKSHFVLMGTSKEDYPALPNFSEEKAWSANSKLLTDMVKKTMFATSTEETRYILNGICFVVDQKELKLVATDGRRLAFIIKECLEGNAGIKRKVTAVVPTKTINELLKITGVEQSEEVKFNITDNQVAFQVKDIVIISRLIEGNFPNYEQVIPRKNKVQVKVNTEELLAATRQMSLLTAEKGSGVKFSFNKKYLRLATSAQGIGMGEVDIDIDLNGENIDVAFNPGYVTDILKNMEEKEVVFELNGSLDAAVLKPSSSEQYLCVIMPMRLS